MGVEGKDKLHYTPPTQSQGLLLVAALICQALCPAPRFHPLSHFIFTSLLKQPPRSNVCTGKLLWGPEAKLTPESERRGKS